MHTKGVIRIRTSKRNRQHNGQKKKYKRANNDQQNIHIKQDRVTPLKFGGELRCSGRVSSSCSTSDIRGVNLVTNQVISHERGKDHWNLHTLYCSQRSTSLTAGLPLPTYLCYVTMWSILYILHMHICIYFVIKRKYQEVFEDIKGVIRIRKSKKDRQHNGQTKKDKRTNNDLQNIHIKLQIE